MVRGGEGEGEGEGKKVVVWDGYGRGTHTHTQREREREKILRALSETPLGKHACLIRCGMRIQSIDSVHPDKSRHDDTDR